MKTSINSGRIQPAANFIISRVDNDSDKHIYKLFTPLNQGLLYPKQRLFQGNARDDYAQIVLQLEIKQALWGIESSGLFIFLAVLVE